MEAVVVFHPTESTVRQCDRHPYTEDTSSETSVAAASHTTNVTYGLGTNRIRHLEQTKCRF